MLKSHKVVMIRKTFWLDFTVARTVTNLRGGTFICHDLPDGLSIYTVRNWTQNVLAWDRSHWKIWIMPFWPFSSTSSARPCIWKVPKEYVKPLPPPCFSYASDSSQNSNHSCIVLEFVKKWVVKKWKSDCSGREKNGNEIKLNIS